MDPEVPERTPVPPDGRHSVYVEDLLIHPSFKLHPALLPRRKIFDLWREAAHDDIGNSHDHTQILTTNEKLPDWERESLRYRSSNFLTQLPNLLEIVFK